MFLFTSHAIVYFISPTMIESSTNWNIGIAIVTVDTVTIFIRHSMNLLHFIATWTPHLYWWWGSLLVSATSGCGCGSCGGWWWLHTLHTHHHWLLHAHAHHWLLHAHHRLLHAHTHHRLLHSHAHHRLLHTHAHHWLLHTHWLLHRHHRCTHHTIHLVVHWRHCTTSAHCTHTSLSLRLLRLLNRSLDCFWVFFSGRFSL